MSLGSLSKWSSQVPYLQSRRAATRSLSALSGFGLDLFQPTSSFPLFSDLSSSFFFFNQWKERLSLNSGKKKEKTKSEKQTKKSSLENEDKVEGKDQV